MIKQIRYFQAVVRSQSFTKAAEECFISQSGISQQIQALEKELGVKLLERDRRQFKLTEAGEYFYKKSLVLMNDYERLCKETQERSRGFEHELSLGYLRHYRGLELKKTIAEFSETNSGINLKNVSGTHEELYEKLRTGEVDLILSDLRRKPSEQYVNFFLTRGYFYAELPAKNPLAQLETLTVEELKNTPIILISPKNQSYIEELFFKEYYGIRSEFKFATTLEEAHIEVASNNGYFLSEYNLPPESNDCVRYIPLVQEGKQLYRKYYAFWRRDNPKKYVEEFARLLRTKFPEESHSAVSE